MHSPNTIDLFAGCGGLLLGLHQAGFEPLFAVEKDPMAFETLRQNFIANDCPYKAINKWPDWLKCDPHDIEELLNNPDIVRHLEGLQGQVDLVCGGPPCQGFSVGGIRDGKDSRNNLPQRYLDFVRLVRPRMVLLENVEGMARKFVSKPGWGSTTPADWLLEKLRELGYDANYSVVDASRFGVPQVRRRVIIFGVLQNEGDAMLPAKQLFTILDCLAESFRASKGLSASRPVTVREAIEDLNGAEAVVSPDSPKFLSGTYRSPSSAYAKLMRREIPNSHIPDSHRFSKHGPAILQFYQKVHKTQPHGRLSKAFLLESGTKKDKKVFIDPDAPASTITTHPDEFIHYGELRNITVREMARLQSFPDDFVFRGRYTINGPRRRFDVARCSQVGNAVPPLLGEAIGEAIQTFMHLSDSGDSIHDWGFTSRTEQQILLEAIN